MLHDSDNEYTDEPIGITATSEGDRDFWERVRAITSSGASPAARGVSVRMPSPFGTKGGQAFAFSPSEDFYYAAIQMVEREEEEPIVPFKAYYPTYAKMNRAQQLSYFTFRKLMRRGIYPEVSLSYVFVYIYEILMNIGVKTPAQGLAMLEEIRDAYCPTYPKLEYYLDPWMRDYVVYYDLCDRIPEFFEGEIRNDTAAEILQHYQDITDQELFSVMVRLARSQPDKSPLYRKYPDEFTAIVARSIRLAAPVYCAGTRLRFETVCLGRRRRVGVFLFQAAVFYNPHPPQNREVPITPRRSYACVNGVWMVDTYPYAQTKQIFEEICQEVDRQLRIYLKYPHKLKQRVYNGEVVQRVGMAIEEYYRAVEEANRPRVEVNLGRLDSIRQDAASVREALLDGVEAPDADHITAEYNPVPSQPQHAATPTKATVSTEPMRIPPTAREFLALVLNGADWRGYLRATHTPLGVMVEAVNTALYPVFQDTVLEEGEAGVEVVEDYRGELANAIQEEAE